MDGHPHRCSTDFEQILRRGEAVELDVRHPSGRRGEATESDVCRPSGTNPLRLTGNNTELYMEIFCYRRKKLTRRPYLPLSRRPRFFFTVSAPVNCLGARFAVSPTPAASPDPRGPIAGAERRNCVCDTRGFGDLTSPCFKKIYLLSKPFGVF
jgi:hypothetical protein